MILTHADSSFPPAEDPEANRVISSLEEKVQAQIAEIEQLREKLSNQAKEHEVDVSQRSSKPR